MKTLILTAILALTALSGAVAISQPADAGGKLGMGGSIDPAGR